MTLGELKRIEASPHAVDVPALAAEVRRLIANLGDARGEVRDLQARTDKAERSLMEIIHTVKRIADGRS